MTSHARFAISRVNTRYREQLGGSGTPPTLTPRAPSKKKRRDEMYSLRLGVLHGSELIQIDQGLDFGWDPPWWNEFELFDELSSLTRLALRNWLKDPPAD